MLARYVKTLLVAAFLTVGISNANCASTKSAKECNDELRARKLELSTEGISLRVFVNACWNTASGTATSMETMKADETASRDSRKRREADAKESPSVSDANHNVEEVRQMSRPKFSKGTAEASTHPKNPVRTHARFFNERRASKIYSVRRASFGNNETPKKQVLATSELGTIWQTGSQRKLASGNFDKICFSSNIDQSSLCLDDRGYFLINTPMLENAGD